VNQRASDFHRYWPCLHHLGFDEQLRDYEKRDRASQYSIRDYRFHIKGRLMFLCIRREWFTSACKRNVPAAIWPHALNRCYALNAHDTMDIPKGNE